MSAIAFEAFVAEAMRLSKDQRSQLADRLIASLDEDFEITAEWQAEISRRAQEIDDGVVTTLTHDEVMNQARALISEGRSR